MTETPTTETVTEALRTVIDPEIRRNIVDLDMVSDISIDGGRVTVTVLLTIAGCRSRTRSPGTPRRRWARSQASPRSQSNSAR